jgi:heme exporter protein B
MFHVELPDVIGALAVVLLLGTVGVAATGTLFGAMTVRTGARELVLASVLFPLLTPALVSGVAATREIFALAQSVHPPPAMEQLAEVGDYLGLLAIFSLVGLGGGIAFFGILIEE